MVAGVRRASATVCALAGSARLVVPATAGPSAEPTGVRRQLVFLRAAWTTAPGRRRETLFPEGYFFLHALYGLTWVELGLREPAGQRQQALRGGPLGTTTRLDSPPGWSGTVQSGTRAVVRRLLPGLDELAARRRGESAASAVA